MSGMQFKCNQTNILQKYKRQMKGNQNLCQSWILNETTPIRKSRSGQASPDNSFFDFHQKPELSSTYFTSIMRPKRKYQNIHLFAQILTKQIRAKTIAENFERSNLTLNQHLCSRQGFKGNKIKINSTKKQPKGEFWRPPATAGQFRRRTEKNSLNTTPDNRQECKTSKRTGHKDKGTRPNFNISLNIYRRKFKSRMINNQNSTEKRNFNYSQIDSVPKSSIIPRNTTNNTEFNQYNKKRSRQNTAN